MLPFDRSFLADRSLATAVLKLVHRQETAETLVVTVFPNSTAIRETLQLLYSF